ncbi:uncharacterized protein LOC113773082 [Coffea eugenioides]|uniref:Uncharacterized protein LOC113696047 isoform X2 n=1 Tax=Coffea arabica TaxID=13443 RepID=A0A6P6SZQ0_COFAR|nr:uncharacterized protein LOC113696047 isoform X2 [Coffea arabica]XP_027173415.1 uncharacterized protein LOC113773082 [Coffea eugenioides]XP_027173416.1 uncharacterized protein LOC113773082 [Coffea eugenioides]
MEGRVHTFRPPEGYVDEEMEDYIKNGYPSLEDEITFAVSHDKKETFVTWINGITYKNDIPRWCVDRMFLFDSINCMDAVLNGEMTGKIDFTVDAVPHNNHGELPALHKAATSQACRLTELFLGITDQANVRLDFKDVKGWLPLNFALENLRSPSSMPVWINSKGDKHKSYWMANPIPQGPTEMVFKLLYYLLWPFSRSALEVVRLLAQKTKEVEFEFFKYVKEQKLVELAGLLLVAHEKVMPGLEERMKIRNFVLKEAAFLNLQEIRSLYGSGDEKSLQEVKKKKVEMEAILLLLEVFDRIGDKLSAYVQIVRKLVGEEYHAKEIGWILEKAGFSVKLELFDETSRGIIRHEWYLPFLGDTGAEDTFYILNRIKRLESHKMALGYRKLPSICGTPIQQVVASSSSSSQWSSASALKSFHTFHPVRASGRCSGSATWENKACNWLWDLPCKRGLLRDSQDLPSANRVLNMQYRKVWACVVATLKRGTRLI